MWPWRWVASVVALVCLAPARGLSGLRLGHGTRVVLRSSLGEDVHDERRPPPIVQRIFDDYRGRIVNDYQDEINRKQASAPLEERLVDILLCGGVETRGVWSYLKGANPEQPVRRAVLDICASLEELGASDPTGAGALAIRQQALGLVKHAGQARVPTAPRSLGLLGDWEIVHSEAEQLSLRQVVQERIRTRSVRRITEPPSVPLEELVSWQDDLEEQTQQGRRPAPAWSEVGTALVAHAVDEYCLPRLLLRGRVRLRRQGRCTIQPQGWAEWAWEQPELDLGCVKFRSPFHRRPLTRWSQTIYTGDLVRLERSVVVSRGRTDEDRVARASHLHVLFRRDRPPSRPL